MAGQWSDNGVVEIKGMSSLAQATGASENEKLLALLGRASGCFRGYDLRQLKMLVSSHEKQFGALSIHFAIPCFGAGVKSTNVDGLNTREGVPL